MQHELQVRILKELLQQLDEKKNVDAGVQYRMPTSDYVCPQIAASEWEVMFQNHPQLIGLSGDLSEPNSYFTSDDFGTPVLATRDSDGVFHAFLNACRHRGVKVATEERGMKRRFTCPFHAWTYSVSGELVAIPHEDHFGPVDKSCHGLIELPCVEVEGMLWVHPQPNGELDIDELLGGLKAELATANLADQIYAGGTSIDMKLNWKLANDTFGETYHFPTLHKNTLGQIFHGNNLAYEEFGRHHRFVTANKQIDGLRDKPESEWRITDGALVIYYLFPNIQLVLNVGRVSLVRIYPDPETPGRSITKISSYHSVAMADTIAAMEAEAAANADKNNTLNIVTAENVYDGCKPAGVVSTLDATLEVFYSTVEKEDYVMGEHQQRNAESGVQKEVIFGRNEQPLHHFHNSYREALGMPPLDRIE